MRWRIFLPHITSDWNSAPSESTSDSDSSSDSDSEPEEGEEPDAQRQKQRRLVEDDDEDGEPAATSEAQVRTKNELVDCDLAVPEISQVGPDERLEKVGEIMSIVNNVVIIKGVPSPIANRGSEKALDSETLLIFDDRNVLGYVRIASLRLGAKRQLPHRSLRLSAPPANLSIKSSSTQNGLWMPRRFKLAEPSSTSQRKVTMSLFNNSGI